MAGQSADEVLQRLQEELDALKLQQGSQGFDLRTHPPKGAGPRLFCGHVPKEATEDLVKAHFSRWGLVTDVYFPRHKKTLKRRPFCFVTFAARAAAECALAESPLNICGIPIKNLTMVEDRDQYYKEKHAAARAALMGALQSMGAAGAVAPEHVNNIAAMLALEGVSTESILASILQNQPLQPQQAYRQQHPPPLDGMAGYPSSGTQRYSTGCAPTAADYMPAPGSVPWPEQNSTQLEAARAAAAALAATAGMPQGGGGLPYSMHMPSTARQLGSYPAMSQGFRGSLDLRHHNDSFSSLSSADAYSRPSSVRNSMDARNSLELGPNYYSSSYSGGGGVGGMPGLSGAMPGLPQPGSGGFPAAGTAPATRLSLDAALQVRHQLLAAAAVAAQTSGGFSAGFASSSAYPASLAMYSYQQQLQQQQQQHQAANDGGVLRAMQSSLYAPTPQPAVPAAASPPSPSLPGISAGPGTSPARLGLSPIHEASGGGGALSHSVRLSNPLLQPASNASSWLSGRPPLHPGGSCPVKPACPDGGRGSRSTSPAMLSSLPIGSASRDGSNASDMLADYPATAASQPHSGRR